MAREYIDQKAIGTLDWEDLTKKQILKLFSSGRRMHLPSHMKEEDEREEDAEKAEEDRESTADLHAEKGDSKAPKVTKDDLPEAAKKGDDDGDDKEGKEDDDDKKA